MIREEATEKLKMILEEATAYENAVCYVTSDDADALDTAIKALEFKDVLDKIRAEIKALSNANPSYCHTCDLIDRDDVLEIIDKYRAESEDKE